MEMEWVRRENVMNAKGKCRRNVLPSWSLEDKQNPCREARSNHLNTKRQMRGGAYIHS